MSVLMLALAGSVLLVVDVVLGRVEDVIARSATLLVCGGLRELLPQLVGWHAARAEARADPTAATGSGQGAAGGGPVAVGQPERPGHRAGWPAWV